VRAETLDLDLSRLGAPDPNVWTAIQGNGVAIPGDPATLAMQAKQRFAILSTQMALAMSSALLQPASTTGYSGYQVGLEAAGADVHSNPVGNTGVWPTTSGTQPSRIYLPGVHVQKGLPYSFEVGGRFMWLDYSNYYAAQGEAKWAVSEGFQYVPDLAVRAAYTRLLGVKDWSLSATDFDFIVSMRFAASGVMSFTPFVAARYTLASSSTDRIDFAPYRSGTPNNVATNPADRVKTQAAFPTFSPGLFRTSVGIRYTISALSLAMEATYFSGATPRSSGDYGGVSVPKSLSGAATLGAIW
jgi:hypothetical protein